MNYVMMKSSPHGMLSRVSMSKMQNGVISAIPLTVNSQLIDSYVCIQLKYRGIISDNYE